MAVLLICVISLLASKLTVLSGFGLNTLLLPVVMIFFPVPMAVMITAIVHLLNNLLKLLLLRQHIERKVLLTFSIPGLIATIPGALLLNYLSMQEPIITYEYLGLKNVISPVKLTAGILLITFATAELASFLSILNRLGLPIGGMLSGFFGGLSGHQGAFRSTFLLHAGLHKESFAATNAAIACLLDIPRLIIYAFTFSLKDIQSIAWVIIAATISAFLGVYLGTKLLKKVTIGFIQKLVAIMLYVVGAMLCVGIL